MGPPSLGCRASHGSVAPLLNALIDHHKTTAKASGRRGAQHRSRGLASASGAGSHRRLLPA